MLDHLFDWLYGVIVRPVQTLNEIAREKPAGTGFLVYIGVALLTGVASTFEQSTMAGIEELIGQLPFMIPLSGLLIGALMFSVVSLFLLTLVLHLFARLFGGSAGYWSFFSAYTFATFPTIINVPLTLLTGFLGLFGSILGGLAAVGISIWVLVLHVLAIRESHGLSTGMSILAYFIALFIIVIIPVVMIIALVLAAIAF